MKKHDIPANCVYLLRSYNRAAAPHHKINWLQLENEMREVLNNKDLNNTQKLYEIDAILGYHTGRGYELGDGEATNQAEEIKK